jgi:hypothetical protein
MDIVVAGGALGVLLGQDEIGLLLAPGLAEGIAEVVAGVMRGGDPRSAAHQEPMLPIQRASQRRGRRRATGDLLASK